MFHNTLTIYNNNNIITKFIFKSKYKKQWNFKVKAALVYNYYEQLNICNKRQHICMNLDCWPTKTD